MRAFIILPLFSMPILALRAEAALRSLPVFWPHDKAGNVREDMLDDAEKAGLLHAASWMRARLGD